MHHDVELALDCVVNEHAHQIQVDRGIAGVAEVQLDERTQLI